MNTVSIKPNTQNIQLPAVRVVEGGRPFVWLRTGWRDFTHTWNFSLGYGVVIALLGWGLVNWGWQHADTSLAFTSGFMLVAPFLALVFYYLSRCLDQHHRPMGAGHLFGLLKRNGTSIGLYAMFLIFVISAWERLSALMVGVFLKGDFVGSDYFSLISLVTPAQWQFVTAYVIVGAVLAGLIFSLSVVSLPMMLDRRVDMVTAMMTSLWVVRENPWSMLLWAGLIAALVVIGFATWFVGLAIIFPVLGHATWHAYRELVEKH
jgi:uncharacterized membrane protein